MQWYFGHVWIVRLLFQRALAAIYLVAFLSAFNQFRALLGERGLLPVRDFVARVPFRAAPSIFHWRYSDRLATVVTSTGVLISAILLSGIAERLPVVAYAALWLIVWIVYLSIVNVGQNFYAFGWESMLVEAGFFTIFTGPAWIDAPLIPILILRWMLFRTEIGAGLIKLRHDRCWRDLTCLFYHYETQPLPNPLSWYFHRLPKSSHRFAVLFSHFVQLIIPFGLFAPQPFASIAGGFAIFHQLWLIVSGNYSWLNWLTVALGITAFDDEALSFFRHAPATLPCGSIYGGVLIALAAVTVVLSIQPTMNLFARHQLMNYSYNPLHLVNTYGAFGSVTKRRFEIIIEGTEDPVITDATKWREYEFRGKPVDPGRMPPQVAPYHLRLDWLMWFLPFSVVVGDRGIFVPGYEAWFIRFIRKLLENDAAILKLLRRNPFAGNPPSFVRAAFYRYRYTTWRERKENGAWWVRERIDFYLPPVSLNALRSL